MARRPAALPIRHAAADLMVERERSQYRKHAIEERQIEAAPLPRRRHLPQSGGDAQRAIQSGYAVRHRKGRQHGLAIRETIHGGEAGQPFDQRAETRLVLPGTGLPPAGDADEDQARISGVQHVRTQPHALQGAGPIIFDQRVAFGHELQQDLPAGLMFQIQAYAFFIAAIGFPVGRNPTFPPPAKLVPFSGRLDLDDIGAEIRERGCHNIARHQPRQIENAHPLHQREEFGIRCRSGHSDLLRSRLVTGLGTKIK